MTKEITGDLFIPTKRRRPANISRNAHVGESIRAMKRTLSGREDADNEFPNNSVNIDKFPEMFMGQTNGILFYKLVICRNILK